MLYGRRKVGKTFLVRNFVKYTHYFFVERAGPILMETDYGFKTLSYETFKTLIYELLKDERNVIVVDEFQRLPEDFVDLLHFAEEKKAKLILLGSSMRVLKNVLSAGSPLLGLVKPVKLDLIRPSDMLKVFSSVEELVFLRDPWLIQFYEGNVRDAVKAGFASVRGLIGEIFLEENRELTETYEGILRALAVGYVFPKDVASFLGKTSSDIKSFLANLLEMGLVKRIKVFGKKKWIYKITSPVIDLFYYLDTKYGISELSLDNKTFEQAYKEKLPKYFEDFVRTALAEKYGGEEEVMLSPEVDVVVTVRGKVVCCAEVKIKARKKDLELLKLKTSNLDCDKLIVDANTITSLLK
ncbi:AAA family ATPase [Archaeoglobus profundus]|uniref:AAA domain-containing protein n=1 Tax=Archaeoglobus profundus (strain DSM 5631 / JCM 9629 / NBRC 100127 / Av18) TaxID=572546 RepID=D2RDQ1_ARCPA|nr:AAA family ATPase [Archaeoglobus profundus]ADB58245.1 hypothetical protein Arcpr_1193 [Archaeoglobus profundus DSM 5631]